MKNVQLVLEFYDTVFPRGGKIHTHTHISCFLHYVLCIFCAHWPFKIKKNLSVESVSYPGCASGQASFHVPPRAVFVCGAAALDGALSILRPDQSNNICDCELRGMLAKSLLFYFMGMKTRGSCKKRDASMFHRLLVLVELLQAQSRALVDLKCKEQIDTVLWNRWAT